MWLLEITPCPLEGLPVLLTAQSTVLTGPPECQGILQILHHLRCILPLLEVSQPSSSQLKECRTKQDLQPWVTQVRLSLHESLSVCWSTCFKTLLDLQLPLCQGTLLLLAPQVGVRNSLRQSTFPNSSPRPSLQQIRGQSRLLAPHRLIYGAFARLC